MRTPPARTLALVSAVLITLAMTGCARLPRSGPLALLASRTPTATATRRIPTRAPTRTPKPPTATPAPTATPTPRPTPLPGDAAALLDEIQSQQQAIHSARGQMEIAASGQQFGQAEAITLTIDFESADPDMHMRISGQGLPLTAGLGSSSDLEIEAVFKDGMSYLKMGSQWMALPSSAMPEQKAALGLMSADDLDSYLADAAGPRLLGRRTIKGEECDVIGFELAPDKMRDLAALSGQASAQRVLAEDIVMEEFEGEIAAGTKDRLMRQMVLRMSGHDRQKPDQAFNLAFTISLWDLNATDITIEAPEIGDGLALPAPSRPTARPMAAPAPLHAYQSIRRPVVDGIVDPADGWDQARAVSGPYADGTLQVKALHDGKDLYLLLIWDEKRYQKAEGLHILFEDGGTKPARELDGKNDDAKYVGKAGLPEGYRDAAWEYGWLVGEPADGSMAGRYGNGQMVVEWRGPLNAGTEQDISVSGDETLGFAIVNWSEGSAGMRGSWPPGAEVYEPTTWGDLVIHFQTES